MGNRRIAEWSLVTLVLVVLLAVFGHKVREVQIQAERATVQSTLGTLRTALVLSHLAAQVQNHPEGAVLPEADGATAEQALNPFLALKALPTNFFGTVAITHADTMPQGTWAFDPDCACLGYRLLYPEALQVPEGADAVWFRVEKLGAVLQLVPLAKYGWQGQILN